MTSPIVPHSIPCQLASHYGYPLQTRIVDGKQYYSLQDWAVYAAQTDNPRRFCKDLTRKTTFAAIKLPYVSIDGKTYKMAYVDEPTLLVLTTCFNTPFAKAIAVWWVSSLYGIQLDFPDMVTKTIEHTSGYVYVVKGINTPYFKIGHSKYPDARLSVFGAKMPMMIEVALIIEVSDRYALETELHRHFADKRVDGEWFNLSITDIEHIKNKGEIYYVNL